MADNDWTVVSESPATDAGASEWEIASEVPTGPQAPGPTPGLVSFINEPKKTEQPKIGSVFDTIPFEPEFNPQEAERLSRRAYAEESARPAVAPGTMKPSPAKNTLSDIATGLASGLKTDLDKAYSTGVRGIGNWIATESIGNKELGETGKALEEIGAKGYRKAAKEEARAQPTFESSTAAGLYSGARSLEQMLAAFAASGGNPTGTLAILSGASGMQGAGEALEKGKPWDTAAAYGTAQAGLEFLTEKMPMGYVASKLGKEGFMRFMGGFLLREMPSEQIATITQDALEQAVLHPEKTWMDYVKDRPEAAYQTLLATAVMTGGMGGISGGQKYMVDRADAARAEAAKQAAISKWEQGFGKKPVTIEDVAKTAAAEAPKAPAAADWEVVSEEPSAVTPAATPAATPAVQRMQEQQRAAEELEGAPETPAEPTDPQERYKNLTGRMAKVTELFRENAITNAEYEDFQRQLEEARKAAQAAPTEGLSEAKQEILRLAEQIEALGQKDFASGMRLRATAKAPEPRSSDMQYYHQRAAELQFAKAPKEEAAEPETYGLQQFFADDQKETDRLTQQLAGKGRIKLALQETNDAIQSLHDTIRNAGFTLTQQEVPDGIKKLKSQIGILAAGASRLSRAQEAIDKGYKRADPKRFKADLDELRNDIDAAYELTAVEPNRPTAAEEMEGAPVPETPEVAELTEQQRKATEDRGILSRRTAGTSLMNVLKGTLNDGELSELGGRARKVGKNPFLNLKVPKGQTGASMEDMVDSGALDLFLPENMKPGAPGYVNSESAEFIRDKLRNGQYYTQETAQAIEMVDRDIDAIERQIADLLSEDEINKEIQYAVNEQRELDQAAAEPATEEAAGAAEERAAEEEVLKAQTEQELRDKQAEIDRLEKENARLEKEAKAKAEAPKAEEFVLTGSERAADQAAARGQMELAPAEEAKQPDMEAPLSAENEAALPDYLKAAKDGPDAGEYRFRRLVQVATERGTPINVWSTKDGLVTLAEGVEQPKYARLVAVIQPETKERPSNMYKALEQQGFKRLDRNDDRVYRDQGGKAYPTFEKNGARIAMTSNNILYENDKGDVEIGYGEPEDTVVHALLVDPATRGQGVASKVMDELGALADEYGVTLYLEPTAISDKPVPTMKLVQFYEGKGYEFDGDSSKVMVRQPGGQTFLNIEPVGESVAGDASTRAPSLKRKVKDLNRQREQGKISDERFVNEVDWAVKQDEEQRGKQMPRERVRGADFIRQKLLEAKRRGDLSAEAVDLAEWFILQNEALVDELGIAIKTPKQGGTGGTYNALARIMTLMKEAGNNETVVHEILHHLERMMPAEVQDAIRKEWMSRLLKAQKNAKSPQEKLFFAALLNHHLGSGKVVDIDAPGAGKMMEDLIKRGMIDGPRANSYQLAIDMLRNGILPVSNYQYATPSEFWAVNGSEIVRGRHNAVKGGVLARLKNWLKELGQKIKSLFGMHSDAPLLRALDSLAKGDGKFVSKDMLYQGENFLQVGKNIYGRTPMVAWTKPDETKLDDFIYKMQDKHIDTKRVIQGIEESIGRIDDKWNPYLQEELFHGRTATETKEFLSGEVRPLLEQMQKEGVTIADLEEYLHNRFAPVRNENIAKINPLMPDGGSGIDTADAEAYMAALTTEQKAKYEKLAARVDAITAGTRQYLVASGLESADTIKEWEESSPDYVPLNREDVEYSTSIGTGTGLGYSVRGPSSRRATGSERKVVDILANTIMQRERALVRGEKNRVATALYGLAMQNPNPEYWLAVNPDAAQSKKKVTQELVSMGLSPADAEGIMKEPTQKVVDPQTGMVTTRINPVLRSADNVLGVRINGKDRFIFFNTQDERGLRMAKALKNLDADQLGQIMTKMAAITRYFASINTQYNPVFGLYNFLRDLQGGAIQLSGTPIEDMRSEVLSPKNLVGALRGIYQTLRATRAGTQQTMTPWADLWTEFQREGGQTGYRDMFSRSQERANALQKELDRLNESKGKKTALAVPRAIFDWLADYNETLENAVRLTAYKAALDKGLSKEQAASVAKNLTVNFNRKGQTAVQAGALYAFFNSSVQGTSRLLQTIVKMDRPGDIKSLHLTKAGKVIIYGGLLAGSIQAMLLAAMGFDDEEPPDFVKDRNLIIPMPGGKYLAWPLPLGYHVIPAFSRILTEWAIAGGKDPGKRVAHLTSLLLDAFSPIGNAGLSVQSIAPTIFDPIVALAENKDWTGKKIAKEDFNKLDPTPGYTRAKQNASWIGKQLSYYLNLASGGDKDKPGVVSPTPDQIDYLIGQATGGVGREVMKATKTAEALRSGEELAPYNIPIVGRFYGDTKAGYAESARFYKNLEEINILENQLRGRQKRREGSSSEFISENPKVRLAQAAHETERNIQKLRKHRDQLIEKDAPRDQVKAIENRMTAQMKRLNEKAQKLEK